MQLLLSFVLGREEFPFTDSALVGWASQWTAEATRSARMAPRRCRTWGRGGDHFQ